MTDAEKAYTAAVAEIERVREAGEPWLSLSSMTFRMLDRLPSEISSLRNLEDLDLSDTEVSDLAPIAQLTNLQTLRLDNTPTANLDPIANLTKLRSLSLERTEVSDIGPLFRLILLEVLSLNQSAVEDIRPVTQLKFLKELGLNNTRVNDLQPLKDLDALRRLQLDRTMVSDLSPLKGISTLEDLWLDGTPVTNLRPLASLLALESLWLNGTKVSDLEPISNLKGLQRLRLNRTLVKDLSPLSNLAALERLHIEGTLIFDLRPLVDLPLLNGRIATSFKFANTPFANANDETRRLSGIEGLGDRIRETLAYLKTLPPWPAPLPWETLSTSTAADTPPPQVQAAQAQIDALLRHALVTRVTAAQFAEQIETALRNVPATNGNQLPPVLQTMQEVANVLRHLAPQPDQPPDHLREPELRLRIAHLEAVIERLTGQLRNGPAAREAAEALAKKDGFAATYSKAFAEEAGKKSVNVLIAATAATAVFFLGGPTAGTAALLLAMNKLLK